MNPKFDVTRKHGVKVRQGNDWRCVWTMDSEKNFLDGLGTGAWRIPDFKIPKGFRVKCLLGYRRSISGRVYWGQIDKNEVMSYLDELLYWEGVDRSLLPPIFPEVKEEKDVTTQHDGDSIQDSLSVEGTQQEEASLDETQS